MNTEEDKPVTLNLLTNDTDQDPGDTLVEKIRALPHVKEARTLRF